MVARLRPMPKGRGSSPTTGISSRYFLSLAESAGADAERSQPLFLCRAVRVVQRTGDPWVLAQHAVFDDDRAMHGIDAGLLEPGGFQRFRIGEKIGVVGWRDFLGVPAGGRLACASETGIAGEAGADFALGHHLDQRRGLRCVDDVGRQLQLTDVLLVVDHPGHLGAVEAVLVDQDAARPNSRRHRIGPHADLLAFEVARRLDTGIGPHQKPAVVKRAHTKIGSATNGAPCARAMM